MAVRCVARRIETLFLEIEMAITTETIGIEMIIDTDDVEITETGCSDDYDGGWANGVVTVTIGQQDVDVPVTAYTADDADIDNPPETGNWEIGTDAMDFDGAHEAIEKTGLYLVVSNDRMHEVAEMATGAFLEVLEEATNDPDNDDHDELVELIRQAKEKAEEAE